MRQAIVERLYKSAQEGKYTLPENAYFNQTDKGMEIRYDRKERYSKVEALRIAERAVAYLANNGYKTVASAKALKLNNDKKVVRGYFDIEVTDSQFSFNANGVTIKTIKAVDMIYVQAAGMRYTPNRNAQLGVYRIYFNDIYAEPAGSFTF